MAVKYNYNEVLDSQNQNLSTILSDATTTIDTQADLISQISNILTTKAAGKFGCKYFWIKYDTETADNINIIEFKIDTDADAYPEKGQGEDGFYYQRITHVLIQDDNNETAILEI